MVTTILFIALLVLVGALAVEVGIASWHIRRANRYRREKNLAEDKEEARKGQVDHITSQFRTLDRYATDISWLLKFLYNRYDKFSDIDTEIQKGLKDLTDETILAEANVKLQDMKRAQKLIEVTTRASDRINGCVTTIASQLRSIFEELESLNEVEDDESEKTGEPAGETTEEQQKVQE